MTPLARLRRRLGLRRRDLALAWRRLRWRWRGEAIALDAPAYLAPTAVLRCNGGGRISVGRGAEIHHGAMLLAQGGRIEIGAAVSINPYCVLYGTGGLTIGDRVRIAAHCVLIPAGHRFDDPDRPILGQGVTARGIRIGPDVWLGAGVRVLDGVEIGAGCVIGAGAVVTRSTEPLGVYAGVPARLIGRRGEAGAGARPLT